MILKYDNFQYLKLIKYYNKCLCRYWVTLIFLHDISNIYFHNYFSLYYNRSVYTNWYLILSTFYDVEKFNQVVNEFCFNIVPMGCL